MKMNKDTKQLEEELRSFSNFESFYNENRDIICEISLSKYLQEIISKKSLDKNEIIKKSELSEIYAYQILSGVKKSPARSKVLSLIIAMKLSFDEAQDILKKTGYPTLYAKNPFDCVIIYGLCKKMSVVEINEILFENGLETLG